MTSLFEKSINLGLGLFAYSREKIEEMVEELVNKGEIEKKDARQFAGELVNKGQEQRAELKKIIKGEVEEALKQMNIARKEDLITKDEISRIIREQLTQVINEQGISKNINTKE